MQVCDEDIKESDRIAAAEVDGRVSSIVGGRRNHFRETVERRPESDQLDGRRLSQRRR